MKRVHVTNIWTDRTKLFEGTEPMIEAQLLIEYPWLRTPVPDRGGLPGILEHLESSQAYLVESEDPLMTKAEPGENNLKDAATSEVAHTMLGLSPQLVDAYQAVSFLAGGREVPFEAVRRALVDNDEDPDVAALRAFGFDPNSENLLAVRATRSMLTVEKAEPLTPQFTSVAAATPDGEDVAQEVRAALNDNFAMYLLLAGKHGNGAFLARDQAEHNTWLLKPGSGRAGGAAGAEDESASESAREAAFYHVGKEWGLYDHIPRAELLYLDGQPYAAIQFLGGSYSTLEHRRKMSAGPVRHALRNLMQEGVLHQWAILDYVLGNADRHGQNCLIDDAGDVRLIDHGSAFAGVHFDPAHDQNSFVPCYLRLWSPLGFKQLTPEEKYKSLPRVSESVAKRLVSWLNSLDQGLLVNILDSYGVSTGPTADRLVQLKQMASGMPVDDAINRQWTLA